MTLLLSDRLSLSGFVTVYIISIGKVSFFQQNLVMVTLTNLDSFTAMNVLSSAGVDAIMMSAHFRSTKFQDWAFLYNLVVVYPSKMKLFAFQIDKIFKKQVFLQLISKLLLEKNNILSVKKCILDETLTCIYFVL